MKTPTKKKLTSADNSRPNQKQFTDLDKYLDKICDTPKKKSGAEARMVKLRKKIHKKDWRITLELLISKENGCMNDDKKTRCYMMDIYKFVETKAIGEILKEIVEKPKSRKH